MKIAFVIPHDFLPLVRKVVDEVWPKVEAEYLFYDDYKDAPNLIYGQQKRWNGIIFSGKAPLKKKKKYIPTETLWNYFSAESSTFFKVLLIASNRGWDISRLSIDSYSKELIEDFYRDIGWDIQNIHNQIYLGDVTAGDHNENAISFHVQNYQTKKVCGCVTRLHTVAKELKRRKIPVVMDEPTYDSIRDQVNFMVKLYHAQHSARNHFTIFSIHIKIPSEDPLSVINEYEHAVERANIILNIYRYAKRVGGSVVEMSEKDYLIFSDSKCIEVDSNGFKQLELLNRIGTGTLYIAHIGIGCGTTVLEAREQAEKAWTRIRERQESVAFCLLADDVGMEISLLPEDAQAREMDKQLLYIAQKSSINIQTVYSIYTFSAERQHAMFTAKELAGHLKISVRSTNRLLERLESARFIRVAGQAINGIKGRPSRLIQFYPQGLP